MADGKWIAGLSPAMSVADAARRVLPARFKLVLRRLPPAVKAAHRDSEHVHQLRVATRRATAALRLFAPCLPGKQARKLKELLRRLRRSAGAARDWDVFALMLEASSTLRTRSAAPARDFLAGFATTRRLDAQRELNDVAAAAGSDFASEVAALADERFDKPDGGAIGTLAASRINDLRAALEAASSPPPAASEALHRLRIIGKRLRYSMEIFADCFAAPFRHALYPALEELQEILGRITDAHVAVQHLTDIRDHAAQFRPNDWPRYRAPVERLLRTCRVVLPRERRHVVDWLAGWKRLAAAHPTEALLRRG